MMLTSKIDDWNWIDALQMAMPVFVKLGNLYNEPKYFDRMYEMYAFTKTSMVIMDCIIRKNICGGVIKILIHPIKSQTEMIVIGLVEMVG
jgi:hypothetical protein